MMKLRKIDNAEISANCQYIVIEHGEIRLTKYFGGRASRSGATIWPDWIEDNAVAIKPLALLNAEDLEHRDTIICFSGGGRRNAFVYNSATRAVKIELERWRKWRKFEPTQEIILEDNAVHPKRCRLPRKYEDNLICEGDSGVIARAISFREFLEVDGSRMTDHEVSREAEKITIEYDCGSRDIIWTAQLRAYQWMARTVDVYGKPGMWTRYKQVTAIPSDTLEKFIGEEEFIEDED